MKLLIVIVGPTASGKTALSLDCAQRYNSCILSADSRQIYRYLDIGSNKVTPEELAQAQHFGISIIDPCEDFTVADFENYAIEVLEKGGALFVDEIDTKFHPILTQNLIKLFYDMLNRYIRHLYTALATIFL